MKQVTLKNGELAEISETVYLQTGDYVHKEDTGAYFTDSVTGLHWPTSYGTFAYTDSEIEAPTLRSRCVIVNGDFYHQDYLSYHDIIVTAEGDFRHIDDAYYWASDEEYHTEPEILRSTLWDYSGGPTEKDFRNGCKYGFGVEIEKNELPGFSFDKEKIYKDTGAVLEKDGSVSNGFELKTPIYNLFGDDTEKRLEAFKDFCNIDNNENAGGHIGFSVKGKNDEDILNGVRGFLPLIYAMYPNRVRNSYCRGKSVNSLKRDRERHQAINLRGNYIEFRIFPAVYNFDTLIFRFRFMQLIAKRYGRSFYSIITELINDGTELNNLFRSSVYADAEKFIKLVHRAINNDKTFGTNRVTAARLNEIANKVVNKAENRQQVTQAEESN